MSVRRSYPRRERVEGNIETANLAESRSEVYKLFSTLFIRRPDRSFIESLNRFFSQLETISFYQTIPEEMASGLKAMKDYLESNRDDETGLIVEFTKLLRGFRPDNPPPPPYESIYRGEGRVFGNTTSKLYEEYRKSGLELTDEYKGEPPDHISFELSFMSHLCDAEAKAWREGDYKKSLSLLETEKRLLEEHILVWIHSLCNQVKQHSETEFYRGLAESTESWVTFDHEQIDAIRRSTWR